MNEDILFEKGHDTECKNLATISSCNIEKVLKVYGINLRPEKVDLESIKKVISEEEFKESMLKDKAKYIKTAKELNKVLQDNKLSEMGIMFVLAFLIKALNTKFKCCLDSSFNAIDVINEIHYTYKLIN